MNKSLKITMISVGSVFVVCVVLGVIFGGGKDEERPQPRATDVMVVESNPGFIPTTSIIGVTPTPKLTVPKTTTQPAMSTPKPKVTVKSKPPTPPVYYANCDAVRAAGKAPLYKGQPGYRSALDRDGDGVACEK